MCCQDLKMAEKSQSIERTVSCGIGAATPLCMHNHRRTALIISAPSAGGISVSTLETVANAVGHRIANTSPSFMINFRDHGHAVQEAWYGFPSAACTVNVLEVYDDGACDGK